MSSAPRLRKKWLIGVAGTAGLVAIGVLAWGIQGRRALDLAERRFVERIGTPKAPAAAEPLVGAEDNSATWLQRGAQAIDMSERRDVLELTGRPAAAWSEEERSTAHIALRINADALVLLRRSLAFEEGKLGIDWAEEGQRRTVRLLEAAKLVAIAGRLAAFEQRGPDSATAVEILGRLSEVLAAERDIVAVLGSLAVERLQLAVVHDLTTGTMLDPATLARLVAATVETEPAERLRWSLDIEAVRAREIGCDGWRCRFAENRTRAHTLDLLASLVPNEDQPFVASLGDGSAPTDPSEPPAVPVLRSAIGRVAAVASARRLAALALEARTGAARDGYFPADLAERAEEKGPDPMTGRPIEVVLGADGGLVLTVPEAEAAIGRIVSNPELVPYAWTIPPGPFFIELAKTPTPRSGV